MLGDSECRLRRGDGSHIGLIFIRKLYRAVAGAPALPELQIG
jgi:hypothetical protein